MEGKVRLDSISIIMVKPRFPENIGSAARAMKNMGLAKLIVVNGCSPLHADAYKLASGAEDILERAEEFSRLGEAISEMGVVVGFTTREGRDRQPDITPEDLSKKLIPLSRENTIGLAFGSEKEGLTNEDLSLCHLCARIPSVESLPSLNLAHAVMIVCYELFKASMESPKKSTQLVQAWQLENMFEHMEKTLTRIGFLDPNYPKRIMGSLRRFFGRSQMEEREVRIFQGIWSEMDRNLEKRGLSKTEGKK